MGKILKFPDRKQHDEMNIVIGRAFVFDFAKATQVFTKIDNPYRNMLIDYSKKARVAK